MSQNIIKNENIKKAIEVLHPIPKIGTGEDFASIGSYLLCKNNNWITSKIIHINRRKTKYILISNYYTKSILQNNLHNESIFSIESIP